MATAAHTAQPTSADVFALLEHVLASARLRLRREAKPIAFELIPSGEAWMFDPLSDGALFARREPPPDVEMLRLRCTPELLARLVTDPAFELRDEDDASYEGRIEDLLLLVSAFAEAGNAIGIRAVRKTQ